MRIRLQILSSYSMFVEHHSEELRDLHFRLLAVPFQSVERESDLGLHYFRSLG